MKLNRRTLAAASLGTPSAFRDVVVAGAGMWGEFGGSADAIRRHLAL